MDKQEVKQEEEDEDEEEEGLADFSHEWEERVRRSVFQPGYLPQPAPQGCLPFLWSEHVRYCSCSSCSFYSCYFYCIPTPTFQAVTRPPGRASHARESQAVDYRGGGGVCTGDSRD